MRGKYMGITLPIQETRDSALLKKFIQVADSSLKNPEQIIEEFLAFYERQEHQTVKELAGKELRHKRWPENQLTAPQAAAIKSFPKPTNCKDSDAIGPLEINTGTFLEGCYYGGFGKSGPQDFGELILSSGVYIRALWEEGQPVSNVLVVDSAGNVFQGDLKNNAIKGSLGKAKTGTEDKKKSRTIGYEFYDEESYFEGMIEKANGVCKKRLKPGKKKEWGKLTMRNKGHYKGMWQNDKKHGSFVMTTADGKRYLQEWNNDQLTKEELKHN